METREAVAASSVIEFTVPALPVAQPRARATAARGFARVYTPSTAPVNSFKASVRLAVAERWTGGQTSSPVSLSLTFLMPRPKRLIWKRRPMPRTPHFGKPDIDNLAKAVLDALGRFWHDDSQVFELFARKMYAAGDELPGVEVKLWLDGGSKRVGRIEELEPQEEATNAASEP